MPLNAEKTLDLQQQINQEILAVLDPLRENFLPGLPLDKAVARLRLELSEFTKLIDDIADGKTIGSKKTEEYLGSLMAEPSNATAAGKLVDLSKYIKSFKEICDKKIEDGLNTILNKGELKDSPESFNYLNNTLNSEIIYLETIGGFLARFNNGINFLFQCCREKIKLCQLFRDSYQPQSVYTPTYLQHKKGIDKLLESLPSFTIHINDGIKQIEALFSIRNFFPNQASLNHDHGGLASSQIITSLTASASNTTDISAATNNKLVKKFGFHSEATRASYDIEEPLSNLTWYEKSWPLREEPTKRTKLKVQSTLEDPTLKKAIDAKVAKILAPLRKNFLPNTGYDQVIDQLFEHLKTLLNWHKKFDAMDISAETSCKINDFLADKNQELTRMLAFLNLVAKTTCQLYSALEELQKSFTDSKDELNYFNVEVDLRSFLDTYGSSISYFPMYVETLKNICKQKSEAWKGGPPSSQEWGRIYHLWTNGSNGCLAADKHLKHLRNYLKEFNFYLKQLFENENFMIDMQKAFTVDHDAKSEYSIDELLEQNKSLKKENLELREYRDQQDSEIVLLRDQIKKLKEQLENKNKNDNDKKTPALF